jgi:cytochrome P450
MAKSRLWTFVRQFYSDRYRSVTAGYLRRNPTALLSLQPGRRNPYPLYEQIRASGPISDAGLGDSPRRYVTVDHRCCADILRSDVFGVGTGDDAQLSLLELDPPDHTRLRRLVAKEFTPRRVRGFVPQVQAVTDQLLDVLPTDEPFDLVSAVAAPLPIAVISRLLGIPEPNTAEFARAGTVIGSALGGVQSLAHIRRLETTQQRLAEIFGDIFALRRREPADDVIGRIVAAGETVRPDEMVPLCTLLLIAGFETTVNLIGNTMLALLDHPEQWRLLKGRPDLAEHAVQEGLRYDSPVQRTVRVALEDTEIAGQAIRRGDLVVVALGGANRDPAVFDDPNRFDITRPDAGEHLAFSSGIHYCLGAGLATLEAEVALHTIATRLPDLTLAGRRVRRPGSLIRGMSRFPVSAHHRPLAPLPA